jgi:hypothetical protein
MQDQHETSVADDLLDGLGAFAEFIYGENNPVTRRRIQYEIARGHWPARKAGNHIFGSKAKVRAVHQGRSA